MSFAATLPDDLYITSALLTRPVTQADHLKEKQALQELAAQLFDKPEQVLPRFVELAMALTGGTSAGLSLYEENPAPGVFRWRYLTGLLAKFEDALTPRNFSPCGVTLDCNAPTLSLHPERFYNWISDANIVVPEVLLVPLYFGTLDPIGTLWIVSDAEGHFDSGHARTATELASFVGLGLGMIKKNAAVEKSLEQQETLTREMAHRVKNLFAVAEGMVRLTSKTSPTKEEMTQTLIGRFHALANAHGLVRRSFQTGLPIIPEVSAVIAAIAEPHDRVGATTASRFSFQGPQIPCGDNATNGIALIFHELATNAAKYGALQSEDGRVDIRWARTGEIVEFDWTESGGPAVNEQPATTGFGSKLLKDMVVRQFGGQIDHAWHSQGLHVRVTLPAAQIAV